MDTSRNYTDLDQTSLDHNTLLVQKDIWIEIRLKMVASEVRISCDYHSLIWGHCPQIYFHDLSDLSHIYLLILY